MPRFCPFAPNRIANIYASEVVLLAVECQNCERPFQVVISRRGYSLERSLAEQIRTNEIHFGDPPNVDCCPGGESMNSVPKRVLQYWRRDAPWQRVPELEVEVRPDWLDAPYF